ncbi:hypothetical protein [Pantoea sp. C2G6]|uniref:hypothetical protein n=1 Tax=Pantoea sp. C2G6 TaxID=3243084 RepID=UPI003ED842BA
MEMLNQTQWGMVAGTSGAYDPAFAGAGMRQSQSGGRSSNGHGGTPFNPNHPDVITCNNGIIGGMISGSLGGVGGLAVGLIGGAIAGNCFSNGNGGGGGSGSSSNCDGSNTCSW